jgi:hypothetical protein
MKADDVIAALDRPVHRPMMWQDDPTIDFAEGSTRGFLVTLGDTEDDVCHMLLQMMKQWLTGRDGTIYVLVPPATEDHPDYQWRAYARIALV